MKQTYINPTIAVVKIATHQMLAASDRNIVNENAEKTGGYYNDARGFDFDDEE